ncbi:MAG: dehypoxanthine futalosine cyclase [Bacteroidales bacterium]|nr:dehypoxanthine futalosine cyclase [Bacteroidales bacterium]
MNINILIEKALNLEQLSVAEGVYLLKNISTAELMFTANEIRKKIIPGKRVTWIIDRNVNITNVCISKCKFCSFHRNIDSTDAYITSIEEYRQKINELFALGGNQLLLQGGLHPKLGLSFYTELFRNLRNIFPKLKLHALGPPEIVYLSKKEKLSIGEVLKKLIDAGLDSLPGAGAEILVDNVRNELSKIKCSSQEWLDVMHEAHILNLTTTATMMFGHIETPENRIEHLVKIRETQNKKPANSKGFIAFIPWTFQDCGTYLKDKCNISNKISNEEYIRMLAISRIMLPNITNIQASWLTVGKEVAQICLHAGANDLGSVMIEENVISSAGANYKINKEEMQEVITDAGFEPQLRNQEYEIINPTM